jgi:hypothetical protein
VLFADERFISWYVAGYMSRGFERFEVHTAVLQKIAEMVLQVMK